MNKSILDEYVEKGLLSCKRVVKNDIAYLIYCYTKTAFFAFDWDEVLISHRGKIYREDNFQPVNQPIPKIFNLDEHPTSSFSELEKNMKEHQYEVLDKVNGHLVIVSPDASTSFKNILVSTKGSFEGLAEQDYQFIFCKTKIIDQIRRLSINCTLMFEALVDYDKHLWYEDQKARYGGHDNMILLAATDNNTGRELTYKELQAMAWMLGCPVTQRFENMVGTDVNKWFEHKGIEGYVVHFSDMKHRIKVKTKEYTTVRYMKEMTPEKLVNFLYNSGMENMRLEYDEEMYPILDALELDMWAILTNELSQIVRDVFKYEDKKAISMDKNLSIRQKAYLFSMKSEHDSEEVMLSLISSKGFRKDFKELGKYPETQKAIDKMFSEKLEALKLEECTV